MAKAGRKSGYQEEKTRLIAQEYLQQCVDKFGPGNKKVRLPKVEGLCLKLGIARSTAYLWAEKYKPFSDILEQINQIQTDRCFNEGLAGNYNATIAKLLLAKHGYKEEMDITSGYRPLPLLGGQSNDKNNNRNKKDTEAEEEDQSG